MNLPQKEKDLSIRALNILDQVCLIRRKTSLSRGDKCRLWDMTKRSLELQNDIQVNVFPVDRTIAMEEVNGARQLLLSLPFTSKFTDPPRTTGERDAYSAPSGKKRYRAEPSSPAKPIADTEISGPNLFSFAKNFEIESGNFAAVGSNQAIMYRRRRDDQYVDDHKSDRSNIASRKDPPKVTEATPSTSSLNPGPTKDSTSYADRSASAARPRRPSTKAPISGPSVLAYSSGFSLRGSRAGPGSFSAVGGDQNVVFAEDDLSDSEYHG
ncbi:hypothetical protein J3R30DRAFT_3525648 [Lentinula aciculospora]|uniref:Uncharacterized protein n=1 Tax=Lentinula aciculospora TaxID=153920 RepID=A0A9W9DJ10_9AGAR|nr:hypothetical protein J3R30DRAFT_3525648 [Lentinula aciculospora]